MINVFGSRVGNEELDEIRSSIDNQWLGMGEKVKRFEKLFSERIGQEFILLDNCSNALYLAIKLLHLPYGSKVIVPSNTWVSCAIAVILNNCVPVFADCDYNSLNVTERTIRNVITTDTRAIMVVHYAGLPVKMDAIRNFGLPIIEDTAHAVDSKIDNQYCGTFGDIGVYSFDSMKNISAGELGGITCLNEDLLEEAIKNRYCGLTKSGLQAAGTKNRWWEYELNSFCIKMLPNDITASIALAQLAKLDKLQEYRLYIWERYQQNLSDINWLQLPDEFPDNIQHGLFTYFIRVKNGRRDELAKYLLDNGIYTTLRYQPLHLMNAFKAYYTKELPNCEQYNEEGLSIPLHPSMSNDDINTVIKKIHEFDKF